MSDSNTHILGVSIAALRSEEPTDRAQMFHYSKRTTAILYEFLLPHYHKNSTTCKNGRWVQFMRLDFTPLHKKLGWDVHEPWVRAKAQPKLLSKLRKMKVRWSAETINYKAWKQRVEATDGETILDDGNASLNLVSNPLSGFCTTSADPAPVGNEILHANQLESGCHAHHDDFSAPTTKNLLDHSQNCGSIQQPDAMDLTMVPGSSSLMVTGSASPSSPFESPTGPSHQWSSSPEASSPGSSLASTPLGCDYSPICSSIQQPNKTTGPSMFTGGSTSSSSPVRSSTEPFHQWSSSSLDASSAGSSSLNPSSGMNSTGLMLTSSLLNTPFDPFSTVAPSLLDDPNYNMGMGMDMGIGTGMVMDPSAALDFGVSANFTGNDVIFPYSDSDFDASVGVGADGGVNVGVEAEAMGPSVARQGLELGGTSGIDLDPGANGDVATEANGLDGEVNVGDAGDRVGEAESSGEFDFIEEDWVKMYLA